MTLQKLNRYLFLYALSFFILACCSRIETHYKKVDSALVPLTNAYYKLLDQYCPNKQYNTTSFYNIMFIPDMNEYDKTIKHVEGSNFIGMCTLVFNGFKIEVNKGYWDHAGEQEQRQLLFHELSHCLLYKDHVKDKQNYMYEHLRPMSLDTLLTQVVADIETECSK